MVSGARALAAEALDRGTYWVDCAASLMTAPARSPHGVAVYFHGVLPEDDRHLVDPQERIGPEFLGEFVRAMRAAGYAFVTPDAIHDPNLPQGNLAILSSDDGYASVERLLPVLERESAPLTVFLCAEPSRGGLLYWWDQLHIAGASRPHTRELLKHRVRSRRERDERLRELGLDPAEAAYSDVHRPLSPADVRRLSMHPLLRFGNHTRDHLSVPLLSEADARDQVDGARSELEDWTGGPIRHFAFPYGDHDGPTVALLEGRGYRTAFTTEPGAFRLPGTEGPIAVLPRYRLRGDRSAYWQARIMSRGITAGARLRDRLARWLTRGREAPGDASRG